MKKLLQKFKLRKFKGSQQYWKDWYARGRDSGAGSYNKLAEFKAEILNQFVKDNNIQTVIEFGSGDGNQLSLAEYPQYTGYDISEHAIKLCREKFRNDSTKSFKLVSEYSGEKADLAMSLDVIYHLVEDEVFENYMDTLFKASDKFVCVYSSNQAETEEFLAPHQRHRKFTDYVDSSQPEWKLINKIPNRYPYKGDGLNGSFADFYFYQKG